MPPPKAEDYEPRTRARRTQEPGAYRSAIELYAGELLPGDRFSFATLLVEERWDPLLKKERYEDQRRDR